MQDNNAILLREELGWLLSSSRKKAKLTLEKLAGAKGVTVSASKIQKAETGTQALKGEDLESIIAVPGLGIEPHIAARMREIVAITPSARVWVGQRSEVREDFRNFLYLEPDATTIMAVHERIPGMLQSKQWMLTMHYGANAPAGDEFNAKVRNRKDRQQILGRPPGQDFILMKSAFDWPPFGDSSVLLDQVDHLIGLIDTPMLHIYVLPPFAKIDHPVGGFTVMHFDKMPWSNRVFFEHADGMLESRDPHKVEEYDDIWNAYRRAALERDATKEFLLDLKNKLEHELSAG